MWVSSSGSHSAKLKKVSAPPRSRTIARNQNDLRQIGTEMISTVQGFKKHLRSWRNSQDDSLPLLAKYFSTNSSLFGHPNQRFSEA
jgi:hypothetical protein